MTARKVSLLLAILLFGGFVEGLWTVRQHVDLGAAGCRVLSGRFTGPSYSFEEARSLEVPAPLRVEVTNAFGAVSVSQGAPGSAQLSLRKVVFLPREEAAREFGRRIVLETSLDGSTLRVGTNRASLERSDGATGFETHFELRLPPGTSLKVENDHGAVDVDEVAEADVTASYESIRVARVAGDARVTSRHGDVRLSQVSGSASVSSRFGDVGLTDLRGPGRLEVERGDVEAERSGHLSLNLKHGSATLTGVAGDLELQGEHAEVKVRGVAGRATIATSFADVALQDVEGAARVTVDHGGLEAGELRGGLEARVSFGDVGLDSVTGAADVEVDHGGLRGKGLGGGGRLQVSGDDVSLEGFRGPLRVDARRGSVELVPGGPLTEALDVSTQNGGVRLEVPGQSAFELLASTSRGEVQAELPGLDVHERSPERIAATLGSGGARVSLSAHHGDVVLTPAQAAPEHEP